MFYECVCLRETHKNNLRESEERKKIATIIILYDTAQIICVCINMYICICFYVQAKVIKTPVENN